MSIHAIIDASGVVTNVILLGDEPFDPGDGSTLVEIDGSDPQPGIGWNYEGGAFSAPSIDLVDPPLLTRLAKADLWRRLSDEEAEALDTALQAAPIRLRRIYEAASYLDTTDADYTALHAGIVAALGDERAAEVLAPNV